ncbi:MAG: hypothetical protein FRX48_02463 [Lasallia pustulata]|uniref:PH domain-containing protein n=1 Tax=Lasallia pustulata TaxID=136370 RepID=A0A5M8PXG9_9LECA|nr:MAG: hypothetical protein FRX48_02463 [Lasallia pustulata]
MSLEQPVVGEVSVPAIEADGLEPGSYTAHRLQHATPHHLYLTTRRCFIGPIPEGWLKSHRKSWYKKSLHLSNYSSRAATFSASSNVSHHRQITGLNGPSATAMYGHSFPQPEDVDSRVDGAAGEADAEPVAVSEPPLPLSRVDDQGSTVLEMDVDAPNASEPSSKRKDVGRGPIDYKGGSSTVQEQQAKSFTESPGAASFAIARTPQPRQQKFKFADMELLSPIANESPTAEEPPAADGRSSSMASLLPHDDVRKSKFKGSKSAKSRSSRSETQPPRLQDEAPEEYIDPAGSDALQQRKRRHLGSGLVRFNMSDEFANGQTQMKAQLARATRHRSLVPFRRGIIHPGEIVKIEKMLVRVDSTMQQLPDDYDENDSLKTESRTVEKWREFVVVCRASTNADAEYSLQMYKSRVIPAVEQTHVQKRSTHDIPLIQKTTKVNLYSSLDKTVVIWLPWKKGTMIYILRPRSAASSVEWYTFLHSALGWQRSRTLQINVPDLNVSLRLDDPFQQLEASRDATQEGEGIDAAMVRTMAAEKAVATDIMGRCIEMLQDSPEWENVLDSWLKNEKMGLAWKRYDRLEWIHGANEQKMYGTMAMQKSHELELRPKHHYPTSIHTKGEDPKEEPAPVEGFLIRLTSQRGRVQRFGKMFFKRLYFASHNEFLFFCRPAKALPPPPPKLPVTKGAKIPSASQIVDKTPLIYAVNPFPLNDGQLSWLKEGPSARGKHDQDAYDEAERKVNTLLQAEGYINLGDVTRVRHVVRGSTPADQNVDEGPDVDFHQEVEDTRGDDGKTDEFDDKRTFELVMKNGLIIRLQAYNKQTKREWMVRLDQLVKYWKVRKTDDINQYKLVRHANLENLKVDEEMESWLGQFARKWEVSRSEASPQLYNVCNISLCRTIRFSGVLYRKPRRHSTFQRCGVILCHGHLLVFQGTLRERTGKPIPHIHHERQTVIDLKDCYIYSGLVTEADLLYQNQTFDSNHPGHHALPRVYLEDGWTSSDEDTMTCFVIWQGRRKSFFRANEDGGEGKTSQRLRYVSRLGVPGRSIVFKSRSRAERDHWVMNIGMEIERLQRPEEVRVVSKP